jgi:hypothetical protein
MTLSVTQNTASNYWMTVGVGEIIWRALVVAMYYPSICLEGLRKAMKIFSQDRRCISRDSKRPP